MATDLEIWASIERRLSGVEWSKPRAVARGFAGFDSCSVDPVAALNRNALAAERRDEQKVIRRPFRPRPEPISNEVRERYEYEFAEREGLKIDSGMEPRCNSKEVMPDCCAYHSTLLEVGSSEFYAYASEMPFEPGLVRVSLPSPSNLCCSRCESVGHTPASCPYPAADEFVTRIAVLRREAKKARAA
jgi:hypothetical protein